MSRRVSPAVVFSVLFFAATTGCEPDVDTTTAFEQPASHDVPETHGEASRMSIDVPDENQPVDESGDESSQPATVASENLRLSIDIDPCELHPGDTTTLTGGVRTVDGDAVELTDPVEYDWSAPENWEIDGEGQQVHLSIPDSPSEPQVDIRLTIEDGDGIRVRGGAPIALGE